MSVAPKPPPHHRAHHRVVRPTRSARPPPASSPCGPVIPPGLVVSASHLLEIRHPDGGGGATVPACVLVFPLRVSRKIGPRDRTAARAIGAANRFARAFVAGVVRHLPYLFPGGASVALAMAPIRLHPGIRGPFAATLARTGVGAGTSACPGRCRGISAIIVPCTYRLGRSSPRGWKPPPESSLWNHLSPWCPCGVWR